MKGIATVSLILVSVVASAQSFEGTISWSITTDIKDPKMKAQLAEAEQKMNDPAMQAQMKAMKAKMEDPQFKAMMESNPQMKAQMEKMMGMMESGDMNSMMPKGITIKVKNQNTLTKMEGGMMAGEILYVNDNSKTYLLDRENKMYTEIPAGNAGDDPNVEVVKTSESAKIMGYTCSKYEVTMNEQGRTITQYVWSTTELKGIDLSAMHRQPGKGKAILYSKIEGVPLKMEMTMPEMTMTMEVKEIKKESLAASNFTIPSDFKKSGS